MLKIRFALSLLVIFNCRSNQWWENDIENNEGKLFEPLASDNGLHQLISEPTHLMGESKSSIDLIFTDQPNLIIESGVHPSLHEQCHHQIVFGKLSVSNIVLPPYIMRGEWPSGLYSLRQVTEVKLGRVRSDFGWVTSED